MQARNACLNFLNGLPLYVSETGVPETLGSITEKLDSYMHQLAQNKINSTAAMQIRDYTGDCFPYPFMVLITATSSATAMPACFHENNFLSVLSSVLNKSAYLKMGRFKCQNRC